MPEVPALDYYTPELEEVIQDYIEMDKLELNTCLPAIVKAYDSVKQTCTVQPSMKRTTIAGEVSSRAEIEDVPVVFPRSGAYGFTVPITVGDSVMLIFSQRSLDDWIDNGGEVEVTDYRLHDINDAIAIPGLFPLENKITPAPAADAAEVRGNKILLGKSGASDEPMVLGNVLQTNLEDLITAIEDLVALIKKPTVIVTPSAGGSPGLGTSEIITTSIETALAGVKSALPNENSDFIFGEKA